MQSLLLLGEKSCKFNFWISAFALIIEWVFCQLENNIFLIKIWSFSQRRENCFWLDTSPNFTILSILNFSMNNLPMNHFAYKIVAIFIAIFIVVVYNFFHFRYFIYQLSGIISSCFKYWSFSNKVFLKMRSLRKKKKKKKS